MVIAAALILTVLSFWAVALPFFSNRDNSLRAWLYKFEDSTARYGTTRPMVKQLEIDYKTGILSEEDYRSRQNELQAAGEGEVHVKTEGAGLDDEIESRIAGLRSGGKAEPGDEIEAKVRELRRSGKAGVGDEIEDKVRQLRRPGTSGNNRAASSGSVRQGKARFCSQCGTRTQSGDRFCPRCGKQIT